GLAEDLRRFLDGESIEARPVGNPEKLLRWCQRNPALAVSVFSVIVLLVLAAVGSFAAAVWLKDERDVARGNLVRAEKAERDKTAELSRSHLEAAGAGRLAGREGQGFRGLEMIQRITALVGVENLTASQVLELRNEAIACLATPDVRLVQQQEPGDELSR